MKDTTISQIRDTMSDNRSTLSRSPRIWLLHVLVIVTMCAALLPPRDVSAAQTGFPDRRSFGMVDPQYTELAIGDMNSDGLLDIVAASSFNDIETGDTFGSIVVYLNDGLGNFDVDASPCVDTDTIRCLSHSDDVSDLVLADINGNGLLDIVVTSDGGQNAVYPNTGGAVFSLAVGFGTGSDTTTSVSAGDMDNDGDFDLVTGNRDEESYVYRNNGSGSFTHSTDPFSPVVIDITSLSVGDLNGDGWLDIAAGVDKAPNVAFLNQKASGSPEFAPEQLGSEANPTTDIAIGDLDRDGDQDIVAVNDNRHNTIYTNVGNGTFPQEKRLGDQENTSVAVAVADLNYDGYLDIVVGNQSQQDLVYFGSAGRSFSEKTAFGSSTGPTTNIAVGDMDRDVVIDIVVTNELGKSAIYLNDGEGNVARPGAFNQRVAERFDSTTDISIGDMNGDGTDDVVVANYDEANYVYLNTGSFDNEPIEFGTGYDTSTSVDMGDIDGDGDMDVVVSNDGEPNAIYWNHGGWDDSFVLTDTLILTPTLSSGYDSSTSVVIADIKNDSDGHLDIVVGNDGGQNVVYLNDGSDNFTSLSFGTGTDTTAAIAVADIDGTNGPDIVVGNNNEQNVIYKNNGDGSSFAVSVNVGPSDDATTSLAVGYINDDALLDIVVGNEWDFTTVYLQAAPPEPAGTFFADATNCNAPSPEYVCLGNGESATRSVAIVSYDNENNTSSDIVVGNEGEPNFIYLNDGDAHFDHQQQFGTRVDSTSDIEVIDLNGDTKPDLLVGNNYSEQNSVYFNNPTSDDLRPIGERGDSVLSMTFGDLDGDGYLDIVTGGTSGYVIAMNDGTGNYPPENDYPIPMDIGSASDETKAAVAIADMNGDHTLDIVAMPLSAQAVVFFNDGTGFINTSQTFGPEYGGVVSMATGDMDGDGDIDVVAGTYQDDVLYLNNGDGTLTLAETLASDEYETTSVALGDVDGDGDLDIALGNYGGPNTLVLNAGDGTVEETRTFGTESDFTKGVAFGDFNADGALDIAVGNSIEENVIYLNHDGGSFYQGTTHCEYTPYLYCFGTGLDDTTSVVAADIDASGTLDIATGNDEEQNVIYFNRGDGNFQVSRSADVLDPTRAVGIADVDNDGDSDLASGNINDQSFIYINGMNSQDDMLLPDNPPMVHVHQPGETPAAVGYATTEILTDDVIPIEYTLSDNDGGSAVFVAGFYSLDGGGSWQMAVPLSDTVTTNLAADADGNTYTFYWDTFASGFFGQSDNVVFILYAFQGGLPVQNGATGYFQRGFFSSLTQPFRVRGTQVRVVDEDNNPVEDAIVYRLPSGDETGGTLISSLAGEPFRTDEHGFLQGRGTLAVGDQLFAMQPISSTDTFTLYHTSASPTSDGLSMDTVSEPGVQTLTVSPDNPLYVFDLNVTLEWDSSLDTSYLEQLKFYLERASSYLYDFTNGQFVLGKVTVSQNADDWGDSHVVLYATNRMRPYALQGGIVLTSTVDPDHDNIVYDPGQVSIGANWNRYGTPGQDLGDDWPIILAHELSHYLLFLDDVYIGLNDDGFLVSVDSCTGSAMGDLYTDPNNTEFIADQDHWQTDCNDTLSNQTLQRDEWETISLWYPGVKEPTDSINDGPSQMPLEFTSITVFDPITPTNVLEDPTFYIDYVNQAVSSNDARTFLFKGEFLIDLGSPVSGQNRVLARGAEPGDRLCVFDRTRLQYGCEDIEANDDRLQMEQDETWTPVVRVSPVTSVTLGIQVEQVPSGLTLKTQIYPEFESREPALTLTEHNGVYSGTYELSAPTMAGKIHVWVDEPATETDPRPEAMVEFAIGGNPGASRSSRGASRSSRGASRSSRGASRSSRGASRSSRGASRSSRAPLVSPDGQMIFFTENPIIFDEGQFYTVQGMADVPDIPSGKTIIGRAYNLVATPGTPVITGTVSYQYLSNEVLQAGADEERLTLHFWDGNQWHALQTLRDPYYNLASALSQGAGIYALMDVKSTTAITDIAPPYTTNETTRTITIAGGYFLQPLQVRLVDPVTDETHDLPITSVTSSTITAVITEGLQAREYGVVVENGDGGTTTTPGTFALYDHSTSSFYDNFESGTSLWELTGDWGIVAIPDSTTTAATDTPNHAMTDSPEGSYSNAVPPTAILTTTITTLPFKVTDTPSPTLRFRHNYVLARIGSSQDWGSVAVSNDDGQTWHTLETYSGGGVYGPSLQQAGVLEWTDIRWRTVTFDLSDYAGDTVQLRFSLAVDQATADKGWVLDDVWLGERLSLGGDFAVYLPLVQR